MLNHTGSALMHPMFRVSPHVESTMIDTETTERKRDTKTPLSAVSFQLGGGENNVSKAEAQERKIGMHAMMLAQQCTLGD